MTLALALALRLVAAPAAAQPAPTPGASFSADSLWVFNNIVQGLAIGGDTLYVSGRFGRVAPPTGQLAVLDKTAGRAVLGGPVFDGFNSLTSASVLTILLDGAGGYFVGGDFIVIRGGVRYENVVHVLADGTLDAAFRPNPGQAGRDLFVRALALDRQAVSSSGAGVLYVGGDFVAVGGQTRRDLAALDAATGAVLPLQVTLAYPSNASYFPRVESLLVHEGVLYVGGIFEEVSGQPRRGLAALDAVTGTVLPWRADLTAEVPQFFASPDALALGDGTLYLTGFFDFVNGQRRRGPAEVTLADPVTGQGGAPTPWVPTPSGPDNIIGTDLLVTSDFVYVASSGGRRISRATAAVTPLATGCSSARSLALDAVAGPSGAGLLYVGCQRNTSAGGDPFPFVVAVDAATGQPTGFEIPGAGEGANINALAVEPGPNGRILAAGTFQSLSTDVTRRQGLAAFDLTTGRPTPFAADISGQGQGLYEDLALAPDGRFLYGYSNVVGGASVRLTEFDLVTGARREFVTSAAKVVIPSTPEPPARAARSGGPGAAVENATSAIVVTDTGGPGGQGRVCIEINGVACYDRASGTRLFYTPMVFVSVFGDLNGDLVYLPPGGPLGVPQGAGAEGALVLAAPVEEAPVGRVRAAFVAVDIATGAVLDAWEVPFGRRGPLGFAGVALDRDGPEGPAEPQLYLGGSFFSNEPPVGARQSLVAVDVETGTVGPWAATVSGGTAAALAMAAHRTAAPDGSPTGGGVVYVGGTLFFANGVRVGSGAVAFDAETGAELGWGRDITATPRVILVSERVGAVFVGGSVSLVGTAQGGLVALSPATPIFTTAGEDGAPGGGVPASASLAVSGANPARSSSALALALPTAGSVTVSLYDVLGRRVAVLHEGALAAGVSRIAVDVSALPAGVYVARAVGDTFAASVTLTVVR